MDSLSLIDINKICRFCLSNDISVSIFSSAITLMLNKLNLLKLDFIEYNMPTSICQSCVYRVIDSYNLKQQVETSECRLRDYLNSTNNILPQFPYLSGTSSTTRTTTLCDFPFDDDNFGTKLSFPHHSSMQFPLTATTSLSNSLTFAHHSSSPHEVFDDAFNNAMNSVCDIFESNNSEDIEVADVEIDVSSLTQSESEETTTTNNHTILDSIEKNQKIADFTDTTLDYVNSTELLLNNNNNNDKIPKTNHDIDSFLEIESDNYSLKNLDQTINNKQSKIITAEKQHECTDCGKKFKSQSYLEIHERTHNGNKPFVCRICDKSFAQIGNFTLHNRMHNNDKRFQCEICSKLFITSSNLKAHKYLHINERNYKCLKCERTFKAKIQLNRHIATHDKSKDFQCQLCKKNFLTKTYLRVHVDTVHEKKRKFKCNDCDREFSSSSNYIAHCRIHTGEKPFKCKYCDAKFNQSSSLVRHNKTHSNLSSYKDDVVVDDNSNKESSVSNIVTQQSTNDSSSTILDNPRGNMIISEYLPNEIINRNSPEPKTTDLLVISMPSNVLWDNFVVKDDDDNTAI